MPRTIHVTVSYSVHIEDDKMSNKDAILHAKENYVSEGNVFDTNAIVFETWKDHVEQPRKGKGSY